MAANQRIFYPVIVQEPIVPLAQHERDAFDLVIELAQRPFNQLEPNQVQELERLRSILNSSKDPISPRFTPDMDIVENQPGMIPSLHVAPYIQTMKINHSTGYTIRGTVANQLRALWIECFGERVCDEDDLELLQQWITHYYNHCPSEYFAATLPIMRKDPTVWCVSAWNDNGKPKRINESAFDLLLRTDFFPGLGWMLTKELWKELMIKWPRSYWDDWMREPEISRSSTFGKYGVSHGTYFQNHLRFIKLNDHFVPFTKSDLSYLLKEKYDLDFVRKVYSSQPVQSVDELMRVTADQSNRNEFRLTYRTKADFRLWAKKLEIMDDFRAGVPRTAYRGVVPFVYNNRRVYLAPGANWESYQP